MTCFVAGDASLDRSDGFADDPLGEKEATIGSSLSCRDDGKGIAGPCIEVLAGNRDNLDTPGLSLFARSLKFLLHSWHFFRSANDLHPCHRRRDKGVKWEHRQDSSPNFDNVGAPNGNEPSTP